MKNLFLITIIVAMSMSLFAQNLNIHKTNGNIVTIPLSFIDSISFSEPLEDGISVGDVYSGGIVFYVDLTGEHGLVCADVNQDGGPWGCSGIALTGANGTGVGSGLQNTVNIVTECTEQHTAASICYNLILYGYDDWYLPSENELLLMRTNLYYNGISAFDDGGYWSSSQVNSGTATVIFFTPTPEQWGTDKSSSRKVRAIRSF